MLIRLHLRGLSHSQSGRAPHPSSRLSGLRACARESESRFDKHKAFSPRTPAPLATHATPSRRWRCRWRARACPRARAAPHSRSRAPRPLRLGAVFFATTAPIPPPSARAAGDGTGVGGAGWRTLNSSSRIPVPSARNPSRLYVQDGDFNFAFAAPPSGHGRGHGRGVQHGRGRPVGDVADGKGKKTKTDAAPLAADARRRHALNPNTQPPGLQLSIRPRGDAHRPATP
jgi:hypothetical protein